ncbi:MAG: cytochrome c biogenesis protein ResB [Formosimonas sp.]
MTSFKARCWDFLGSMRLAISLLSILAIASAIGTLVKQNERMVAYIDQFGIFWAEWFRALGLFDVYNQPWFLVILLFLLISTSVCLIRNTPKMLRDMREFKNHTRSNSLRHLPEHLEWRSTQPLNDLTQHAANVLHQHGYTFRAKHNEAGTYLAAKRGKYNRVGYILTHLAIVVICLGGLLDSELSMRAQVALFGKQPQPNAVDYQSVPANGFLASNTLSYRGNINLPEGETTQFVELAYDQDRYLLQELPFAIRLNQFMVDYYSTGMPKRFASLVTVTDKTTGEQFEQTIEVNHPLRYKGVAVYQSSFADGGSALNLNIYPLNGTVAQAAPVNATMFRNHPLSYGGKNYTLEWREFKPINVEPFNENGAPEAAQNVLPLSHALRPTGDKQMKNMGPTIQFILRDEQGDALEFHNYMNPVVLNNFPVFISGVRRDPNQPFNYLAIPADGEQSPNDFMRLRAALANSSSRQQAVAAYVRNAATSSAFTPEQLQTTAQKTIDLFAQGGNALETWVAAAPAEQRSAVVKFAVAQLEGTLWQLLQTARRNENLAPLAENEHNRQFMRIATERLAQSDDYAAPMYVQLAGFKHVQASILQMTRSPGQFWVYLGSLMLVLGTLAMTFIRERRVWLHILPTDGAHRLILAMNSTRRTLDYQQAWTALHTDLTRKDDHAHATDHPA